MDQAAAKTELATLLNDTLQQVSDDRLTLAVAKAWKDAWVAEQVFDESSLVFQQPTYEYSVPTTMTTVESIYLRRDPSLGPERIDAGLYEVIAKKIIFTNDATLIIPSGYTLLVRGHKKLGASDSISSDNYTLQNYVVALAGYNVVNSLGYSKVLSFLRNDTTLAELRAFKADLMQDIQNYRKQLQMSYVDN